MKKLLFIILLSTILVISSVYNSRLKHWYCGQLREVNQLSTEHYIGPTIDEKRDNIFDVEYYEFLDSNNYHAIPTGYYICFNYKIEDFSPRIIIYCRLQNDYHGDLISSSIYLYNGQEIYLFDHFDDDNNLVAKISRTILGDHVCQIYAYLDNFDEINYKYYQDISLEFMFELIENFNNQ